LEKGPRVIFSKGILKKWFLMHFRFFIANLRYLAKKGMPHLLYECVAPSILRMCCMLDLAIHLSYFIISYYVNWRVPIQNTSHFHPSEPSKLTPWSCPTAKLAHQKTAHRIPWASSFLIWRGGRGSPVHGFKTCASNKMSGWVDEWMIGLPSGYLT
jgi:hypothetical protein